MHILRKIYNIVHSTGWSFELKHFNISRSVVRQGDSLTIDGIVINNGPKVGSVYIQVIVANPFDHKNEIYNSHEQLTLNEKHKLRIIDVYPKESSAFSLIWEIPNNAQIGVYDIKIIVWSAPKLYDEKTGIIMDQSPWKGAFEVLQKINTVNTDKEAINPPKVFVSYSWDSEKHRNWVIRLAEEIVKNGIDIMIDCWNLHPGEDLYHFMERGCRDNFKIIIVITDNYTLKANKREGGVGIETIINAALYAKSKDKRRFIPIVRGEDINTRVPVPTYLESAVYIDFCGEMWKGKPFSKLLRAIYEDYEFKKPAIGKKPEFK